MMNCFFLSAFISLICLSFAVPFTRRCRNDQFECNNGNCISKSYWCGSYSSYCGDNSHRINCNKYYPSCSNDQSYCVNTKKCIPSKWACDGYKDCTDNSDEINCLKEGFRIEDLSGVRDSRKRALSWLNKQRKSDWSWGKDTNRALVTLRLSDELDLNPTSVTGQLMLKQLKLQLSEALLTNDIEDIKTYEIAFYVHSLLAICSDPRSFQGFDLVKLLEERIEESESINPMVALAICNSNHTLLPHQVKKLENIFSIKEDLPHWIDSQAYALMTFACYKNRTKSFPSIGSSLSRHKFWEFDNAMKNLSKLQNKDGSFGNIYTTAVLVHALISIENQLSSKNEWNISNAINYIKSQQKDDGSFGDNLATYLILPILHGKTFVNLGSLNCSATGNLTVKDEIDSRRFGKIRVNYFIFVGEDKDVIFTLSLNVPVNSTFYDVMRLAEELDDKFRFKYVDYSWGKYVYSLFGLVNHPEEMNYWQLFELGDNSTILQQSPDKVIPDDDETYVYWYKSIIE